MPPGKKPKRRLRPRTRTDPATGKTIAKATIVRTTVKVTIGIPEDKEVIKITDRKIKTIINRRIKKTTNQLNNEQL